MQALLGVEALQAARNLLARQRILSKMLRLAAFLLTWALVASSLLLRVRALELEEPCESGDIPCFCRQANATGLFADTAAGCQNYYLCGGDPLHSFYMPCNTGLKFNDRSQACDYPVNVQCAGKASEGSPSPAADPLVPSPAPETPSGTPAPTPGPTPAPGVPRGSPAPSGGSSSPAPGEAEVQKFCKAQASFGMFADVATNCEAYFWCPTANAAFYMPCPPELRFNQQILACDWPKNVACGGNSTTAPGGGSRPAGSGGAGPKPATCVHMIKAGDTLWAISKTYQTTVPAIAALNPGVVATALQVGASLYVPCTGTPTDGAVSPSSPAGAAPSNPAGPAEQPSTPVPEQPSTPAPQNPPPASSGSASGAGTQLGETRATYHYYAPNYDVSTLYCADRFAGKSQDWLRQYGWTAYCLPSMPMSQDMCGRCLRLTNLRTQAQEIVRIVDQCGHSSLDLDWDTSFKPLDGDGQGYNDGRMGVAVELVEC